MLHKIIVLLFLTIFAVCISAASISEIVLSQGATAYWKYDDLSGTTSIDSTGHGYNGTYVGTYNLSADGAGLDGNTSLTVNGGYMSVNTPITPSFTIISWAKSATSLWNNHGWLSSSREANGFIMHTDLGSKTVGMYIIDYTSGASYTRIGEATATDITEWHQYGISYDATTKQASVIFDGAIISTVTYSGIRYEDVITIWFGRDQYDARYGNGSIDESALFSRSLSSNEVSAQYHAVLGVPEPSILSLVLLGIFCLIRNIRAVNKIQHI